MRTAILLALGVALAVAACGHPTYGRPAPRDTMPTTKAPGTTEPKPNEKPTTKELNRGNDLFRGSGPTLADHCHLATARRGWDSQPLSPPPHPARGGARSMTRKICLRGDAV